MSSNIIRGKAFVIGDNIDTDQIIPAQYLNLVPTIAEEYEKLGSYALAGLPDDLPRFVAAGAAKTVYSVIIAGRNFGCGSSREHAPVSLGAAGTKAVVAESFARIFFRNCIATGEIYPLESSQRICETVRTGQEVVIDIDAATMTVIETGDVFALGDLGDARDVIDHGGLFAFARNTGLVQK